MRLPLLLVFVLAALPASLAQAAGRQTVPAQTGYNFQSSILRLTSSSGVSLGLQVQMDGQYDPASERDINLSVIVTTGKVPQTTPGETHEWNVIFDTPSFIHLDEQKHTLSIVTGSRLSPFGQLNFTFTPKSASKMTCGYGSGQEYTGSVSGIVRLNTHLSWGSVGSKTKALTFPKGSTLDITKGCKDEPPIVAPCQTGFSWWSPSQPMPEGNGIYTYVSFSGSSVVIDGARMGMIEMSQIFNLAMPPGAVRYDYVNTWARSQVLNPATHTVTITARGGTGAHLSGRATVTTDGTFDTTNSDTCSAGSKNKTQKEHVNERASWTNAAGDMMAGYFGVGGSYSVPDSTGKNGFIQYTFK